MRAAAEQIKRRQDKAKALAQDKKSVQSRARIPRKLQNRSLSQMSERMRAAGIDPSNIEMRAELLAKAKGLVGKRKDREASMDVEEESDDNTDDADESMSMDEDVPRKKSRAVAPRTSGGMMRGKSATTATVNRSGGPISARAGAARIPARNRQAEGMRNVEQEKKARELHELGIRERNMRAKAGESDRRILASRPKWLFTGKRGLGSTRSR